MDRFSQVFNEVPLAEVHDLAARRAEEGWRYVQILAVNTEEGIDLVYSYMKDGLLENDTVAAVGADDAVPSITDLFLEAFVCENEIHDLYGVAIENIAIDFGGMFYQLSSKAPMTVVSPEHLAAREKADAASFRETTLDDLESTRMSTTQKAIIVVAVLGVIAFAAWYLLAH